MAYATRTPRIVKPDVESSHSGTQGVPPSNFTRKQCISLSGSLSRRPTLPQPTYLPALDEFSWQQELKKYKESLAKPQIIHDPTQTRSGCAQGPLLTADADRANASYRRGSGGNMYHPTSTGVSSRSRPPFTGRPDWLGAQPESATHNSNEATYPQHDAQEMQYTRPFFPAQSYTTPPEELDYTAVYGPTSASHPQEQYTHYEYLPVQPTPGFVDNRGSAGRSYVSSREERDATRYDEHGYDTSRVPVEERGRSRSRRVSEPFINVGGYQGREDGRKLKLKPREKKESSNVTPSSPLRLKSSKACHRENCRECDHHQRERGRDREGSYRASRDSHRPRSSSKSHKSSTGVTIVVNDPGTSVIVQPSRSRNSKGSKDADMATLAATVGSMDIRASSSTRRKRVRFSGINDTWPISRKHGVPDLKKPAGTSPGSYQPARANPPGLKGILRKIKRSISPKRPSRSHSRSNRRTDSSATKSSKADRRRQTEGGNTSSGSGWDSIKAFVFDSRPPKTK